jgi:hypothetical protein
MRPGGPRSDVADSPTRPLDPGGGFVEGLRGRGPGRPDGPGARPPRHSALTNGFQEVERIDETRPSISPLLGPRSCSRSPGCDGDGRPEPRPKLKALSERFPFGRPWLLFPFHLSLELYFQGRPGERSPLSRYRGSLESRMIIT